jgi:hypothetical protein
MPARKQAKAGGSLLEEFGVCASTHEDDGAALKPVNQQKVAADVTLAVIQPITLERVIQPFGPERGIVSDERKHRLFQALEVIAA